MAPQTGVRRRFLVIDARPLRNHRPVFLSQGFLWHKAGWHVRVRRSFVVPAQQGSPPERQSNECLLVGPQSPRGEVETYQLEISATSASQLMRMAPLKLFQERFEVPSLGVRWSVDVYQLSNSGLVIAETPALSLDEARQLKKPAWLGAEVTHDRRYHELSLATTPYLSWPEK